MADTTSLAWLTADNDAQEEWGTEVIVRPFDSIQSYKALGLPPGEGDFIDMAVLGGDLVFTTSNRRISKMSVDGSGFQTVASLRDRQPTYISLGPSPYGEGDSVYVVSWSISGGVCIGWNIFYYATGDLSAEPKQLLDEDIPTGQADPSGRLAFRRIDGDLWVFLPCGGAGMFVLSARAKTLKRMQIVTRSVASVTVVDEKLYWLTSPQVDDTPYIFNCDATPEATSKTEVWVADLDSQKEYAFGRLSLIHSRGGLYWTLGTIIQKRKMVQYANAILGAPIEATLKSRVLHSYAADVRGRFPFALNVIDSVAYTSC